MEHKLAGVSFGYLMQDTSGALVDAGHSFDSIEDAYDHAMERLPKRAKLAVADAPLAGTYREQYVHRGRVISILFVSVPF